MKATGLVLNGLLIAVVAAFGQRPLAASRPNPVGLFRRG